MHIGGIPQFVAHRTSQDVRKEEPVAQYKGKVKWFNNAKGYGFIGREDGPDVFVTTHHSVGRIQDAERGDDVEFDIVQGQKGAQADAVVRLRGVSSPTQSEGA